MRMLCIKVLLAFLLFVALSCTGGFFVKNSVLPLYEHIDCIRRTDTAYIRTEQGQTDGGDSIFIEKYKIRLHRTAHPDEDAVLLCEEKGDTTCYISAIGLNCDEESKFLNACLLKGQLPDGRTSIAINEALARRIGAELGDTLCIKTAVLFERVRITGIIRNFYGFPDFEGDARFYCVINQGNTYPLMTRGGFYSFSDSAEGAFLAERTEDMTKRFMKSVGEYCMVLYIVLALVYFLILRFIKRTLWLPRYYTHLYALGKQKATVQKQILQDGGCFLLEGLAVLFMLSFCIGVLPFASLASGIMLTASCIETLVALRK